MIRKPVQRLVLVWIIVALASCTSGGTHSSPRGPSPLPSTAGPSVRVPDVRHLSLARARSLLARVHLRGFLASGRHNPCSTVVAQRPAPGTRVVRQSTVALTAPLRKRAC